MRMSLPSHLAERCRRLTASGNRVPDRDREFVLYWARTALRTDENPALEVAATTARDLGLPLFVYQGISERYPYASDRHHRFLLESAIDFHGDLAAVGVASALHVERRGHRGPVLRELAARSAIVITEDFPTAPLTAWTDRLGQAIEVPILLVDTACVLPMNVVGKAYSRAFAFRRATEQARTERVRRPWPTFDLAASAADRPESLPFEPVDVLGLVDDRQPILDRVVADCDIDHTVPRVPHTVGGGRAGYARWDAFRADRLRHYAAHRNDPLRSGASRMSAYLHYGCVSPMRIAREAQEDCDVRRNPGAEKYLDELLIWRELAYVFCRYSPHHEDLRGVPDWARETLEQHARDPRPVVHSAETLARAATGDRLWDAAQASLLRHGELHNNVRMTWGKAFLGWRPDPGDALRLCIDLNHRYALDGRDPGSYGGILWCFGQFDRPFPPAAPIRGELRPRDTEPHAQRLDVRKWSARTHAPPGAAGYRVAVIGAGIAGALCARTLADQGLEVTVFDKGRGVSGRMATRRGDEVAFDHGAQYFTARDERFARLVRSWCEDGVVAAWPARLGRFDGGSVDRSWADGHGDVARYVGTPGMSAVGRHLAMSIEERPGCAVHRGARVVGPVVDGDRWRLNVTRDGREEEHGPFDAVLWTAPAPQTLELWSSITPTPTMTAMATAMRAIRYAPCRALMAEVAIEGSSECDALMGAEGSPIAWLALDDTKPGRSVGSSGRRRVVIHASADWSRATFDSDATTVERSLIDAAVPMLEAMFERTPITVDVFASHRWKYSLTEAGLDEPCLFDPASGFGFAGDGCHGGGRVEAAALSGMALAGRVLARQRGLAPAEREARQGTLFGA